LTSWAPSSIGGLRRRSLPRSAGNRQPLRPWASASSRSRALLPSSNGRVRQRINAGLKRAVAQGKRLGRPGAEPEKLSRGPAASLPRASASAESRARHGHRASAQSRDGGRISSPRIPASAAGRCDSFSRGRPQGRRGLPSHRLLKPGAELRGRVCSAQTRSIAVRDLESARQLCRSPSPCPPWTRVATGAQAL
jgi:hypothetical protein